MRDASRQTRMEVVSGAGRKTCNSRTFAVLIGLERTVADYCGRRDHSVETPATGEGAFCSVFRPALVRKSSQSA